MEPNQRLFSRLSAKEIHTRWVCSPLLAMQTRLPPELVAVITDYVSGVEESTKSHEFTSLLRDLLELLNTPPGSIQICGEKTAVVGGPPGSYTQNYVVVPLSEFLKCESEPSEQELCEAVHGHLNSRLPWRRMCVYQDRTLATNMYVSDLAERLKKIATDRLGPKAEIQNIENKKTCYHEMARWAWIVVVLLYPLACVYNLISRCFDCHVLTRTRRLRQTWVFSHKDSEQAHEELLSDIVRTQPMETYRYDPPTDN